MKKHMIALAGLSLVSCLSWAQSPVVSPQASSCIAADFSFQDNIIWLWRVATLTLTNHCGQTVDMQNASITFLNNSNLNVSFWGEFSPLSEPSQRAQISSQPTADQYLSTLSLQFPSGSDSNTNLPNGGSITLHYSVSSPDYVEGSARVYLNNEVNTGSLLLTNTLSQPANVTQAYAQVAVSFNGETVSTVALPWGGQQLVSGLAAGTYAISPINVDADDGNLYVGISEPTTLTVTSGDTIQAAVTYVEKILVGTIHVQVQSLPEELSGYPDSPVVTMTRKDNQSAQQTPVSWGATYDANRLATQVKYRFGTNDIDFNGYTCTPTFSPTSALAVSDESSTVNLSYSCIRTAQDNVTVQITGAPTTLNSVQVLFTPNGNAAQARETVTLVDGAGTATFPFTDGTLYTITVDDIEGFTATYSAQPLTVQDGAIETITFTQNSNGENASTD